MAGSSFCPRLPDPRARPHRQQPVESEHPSGIEAPTLPHAVNDGYEIEICIIHLAGVNSFTGDVADRPQNIPLLMALLRQARKSADLAVTVRPQGLVNERRASWRRSWPAWIRLTSDKPKHGWSQARTSRRFRHC